METTFYNKGDELFISGRTYAVISCIRSARESEVYKVERKSDRHHFLLKLICVRKMRANMLINGKPRIISLLDTSNISQQLSIYDWGTIDDGHYYLLTRYFTKGLLSDRLKQKSIKLNTTVNIILDLAKTLSSLQAYDPVSMKVRSMRHGDVCPNNIMYDLDEKGEYKTFLIDIEHMSYIADDNHDAFLGSSLRGLDLKYCAPEIFIDEAAYNSDVFSLGAVFYECCFREYPYQYDEETYHEILDGNDDETYPQYFRMIMKNTPEFLKLDKCGGIAGLVIRLLKGMLEYDPEKRINMATVISSLNVLRQLTRMYDVELDDERCFDDAIISSFRSISDEHNRIYTLSESRIEKDFQYSLGSLPDIYSDIFDLLKEDLGLEESGHEDPDPKKADNGMTDQELGYRPLVRRHKKDSGGFKDVAGMEDLKVTVRKKVLYFLRNPEVAAEYKIGYPNGMLLYGPPGCGKTFFAEKFAEESGFSYALVKASDLGSTYIHGTQGKINALFNEARENAPCVICFDEFDCFVPDRSRITNSNMSGEVNEFLSQLDNCGKDRIFIIATTNNPEGIDPAVLRSGRLEHKVYIPAPDFEARKAVIKKGVLSRPCSDGIDFDRLAMLTEGYVTSDLSLIVNDAAMNAAYSRSFISQQLLEEAIASYRPSVSETLLKEHEDIRRRMESDNTRQKRIGYK